MYNDCAVEMEPEYVGNHEDLKVQAPWGHLQTKSCFCYYKLLFLNSKQFNLRFMHLQTLSHIPFATAPPWATSEWHAWLHPDSLHLCPWERPCSVVQQPPGRGQLGEWEPQWNYPLCFFFTEQVWHLENGNQQQSGGQWEKLQVGGNAYKSHQKKVFWTQR